MSELRVKQIYIAVIWLGGLLWANQVVAQQPVKTKPAFKNGFYRSMEEYVANAPGISFDSLATLEYFVEDEKNELQLDFKPQIENGKKGKEINFNEIWGVCIENVPYIYCKKNEEEKQGFFVKMHVAGPLSYYFYEGYTYKTVTMSIYHPATGIKVAERDIINREKVFVEKLIHLSSKTFYDYNVENFEKAIADDSKLLATFKDLSAKDKKEKLFKTLLIYNDRNQTVK